MAHIPHFMNVGVRLHQAEPWRWQHDWERHLHTYTGIVTFRMSRAHPGPQGIIPFTTRTTLTLDLSLSHPFAQPPPVPPPPVEADSMDIDVPEGFTFLAPGEDTVSGRESSVGSSTSSPPDAGVEAPVAPEDEEMDPSEDEEVDPSEDEEMEPTDSEDEEMEIADPVMEGMESEEEEDPSEDIPPAASDSGGD